MNRPERTQTSLTQKFRRIVRGRPTGGGDLSDRQIKARDADTRINERLSIVISESLEGGGDFLDSEDEPDNPGQRGLDQEGIETELTYLTGTDALSNLVGAVGAGGTPRRTRPSPAAALRTPSPRSFLQGLRPRQGKSGADKNEVADAVASYFRQRTSASAMSNNSSSTAEELLEFLYWLDAETYQHNKHMSVLRKRAAQDGEAINRAYRAAKRVKSLDTSGILRIMTELVEEE